MARLECKYKVWIQRRSSLGVLEAQGCDKLWPKCLMLSIQSVSIKYKDKAVLAALEHLSRCLWKILLSDPGLEKECCDKGQRFVCCARWPIFFCSMNTRQRFSSPRKYWSGRWPLVRKCRKLKFLLGMFDDPSFWNLKVFALKRVCSMTSLEKV